jgi:Uma2 family endonuclease
MVSQLETHISINEYLELERKDERKNEYMRGEIFAMTGASLRHNLIAGNVFAELKQQLKRTDCNAFTSDMRVSVPGGTLYTYPDVVAVCGEPQLEDSHLDTLLNPILIVEVLSKSTAAYDRNTKFAYYRTIPSLNEYLLIAQHDRHVSQHVRQPDGRWLLTDIRDKEGQVALASVGCSLALSDIYDRVSFD